MATYPPCPGTGQPTTGAYIFRNTSGSAKFSSSAGQTYGKCAVCGKGLALGRAARGHNVAAPMHKQATA